MIRTSRWPSRPIAIGAATFLLLLILLGSTFHEDIKQNALSLTSRLHDEQTASKPSGSSQKLHLLLPASESGSDLCKTLLTGTVLGYPVPTLIAWNQTHDDGKLLGGGSHVAKISGVLDYLKAMDRKDDDDLVMMMDAYDIWFQLRPEVLMNRYHSINAHANRRLARRLGRAKSAEGIEQTIIFGAGKRCAPNQMHTIACYPIPDSPLPDDLYGSNTDTVMGRNKYTSLKQRYLNSGYIIGPAADMRRLFERAWEKAQAVKDYDDWDNGSHGSDFMYHGSDQSIFNTIFGEQEYQREVMRRRHMSWSDKVRGRTKPKATHLEGTLVDDPLNPSFTHEPGVAREGKPDEFGIGLDYFSDLGQQTVNTDEDFHYLTYNQNIDEQLQDRAKGRNDHFDCKNRVDGTLPQDIMNSRPPLSALDQESSWNNASLFSNLCLNTIPVMIHHNGNKDARHWQWTDLWLQPYARRLMEAARSRGMNDSTIEDGSDVATGGAYLPDGVRLRWDELCPAEYEWTLYRDVPKPEGWP